MSVRTERNHRDVAKRADAHGFVYFIRAGDGPIKIGWALDPIARLKELQVGNPEPLQLLMTLADDGKLESELHRRFAHLRLCGEWFCAEEELAGLLWLPGRLPPPRKPETAIWGYQHLKFSDPDGIVLLMTRRPPSKWRSSGSGSG